MSDAARVDVVDGVATVTLNDPGKRNALSLAMVDEIVETFDALEADEDVGAVVVTGAGAGLLRRRRPVPPRRVAATDGLRHIYEGFLRVGRSPLPTLAAVNGAAVGAGMNLALACDVRLAGETRPVRHPLPAARHPPRRRPHLDAAPHRRRPGHHGRRCCSARSSTARRPSASAWSGAAWPTTSCSPRPSRWPRGPQRAPRSWPDAIKATIDDVAAIDDHAAAVDRELADQLWSMDQPAFAERLAALQARISGK